MVFELVPFLACTTAAGALGTGAWYVAVKEYGPSNGTYRANPKRNRNEQGKDDSNLESRCDAVDGADSDSIRDYGVGFDLIRLSSGNYAIKSIKPGSIKCLGIQLIHLEFMTLVRFREIGRYIW